METILWFCIGGWLFFVFVAWIVVLWDEIAYHLHKRSLKGGGASMTTAKPKTQSPPAGSANRLGAQE